MFFTVVQKINLRFEMYVFSKRNNLIIKILNIDELFINMFFGLKKKFMVIRHENVKYGMYT